MEYFVATKANKEMIWLQRFMEELGKEEENNMLHSDGECAIHFAKNSPLYCKSKHIHLRYHFIRAIEAGNDI